MKVKQLGQGYRAGAAAELGLEHGEAMLSQQQMLGITADPNQGLPWHLASHRRGDKCYALN